MRMLFPLSISAHKEGNMTKTRKITYIVLFFIVAALFVLGGLYDLKIAHTLYGPSNIMAQIFEGAGIFPPFLIWSVTFALLFFLVDPTKDRKLLKQVGCVAGMVASWFVFGYMAINETSIEISWLPYVTGAVSAALFTPLTLYLVGRIEGEKKKKWLIFFGFASIVCILSNIILVNLIKYIWGRPRFREMAAAGDFSIYTNWYKINGFTLHGHHSFPSGHTASAGALFTFCALGEVFPEKREKERTTAFIVGLYTFTMAYSRIVLGAHFLSDVTAGFTISFLTYAVTRYIYFKTIGKQAPETEEVEEVGEDAVSIEEPKGEPKGDEGEEQDPFEEKDGADVIPAETVEPPLENSEENA